VVAPVGSSVGALGCADGALLVCQWCTNGVRVGAARVELHRRAPVVYQGLGFRVTRSTECKEEYQEGMRQSIPLQPLPANNRGHVRYTRRDTGTMQV